MSASKGRSSDFSRVVILQAVVPQTSPSFQAPVDRATAFYDHLERHADHCGDLLMRPAPDMLIANLGGAEVVSEGRALHRQVPL